MHIDLFCHCIAIVTNLFRGNRTNQTSMGILQDVFNVLKTFKITKIDRQPTDDNINKLTTQLTAALVTISTENGGGTLGHIGIVVPVQCQDMLHYQRAQD